MKFCDFAPVIATSSNISGKVFNIEELAKNIGVNLDKIQEILGCFEFKKQITDLSSNAFYNILLQIPTIEFSKGIDLYKSIYNIIQQPTFKANFEASSNKDKFLAEGKMLVRYEGKLQFIYAREAILPSNTIINKKNLPIVEKGLRTNNENFVKVFGCKKYERTYVIDVENIKISPADQKFQNYFNEFKKYASAFGERNANIAKLGKFLSIKLATIIPVKEKDLTNFMEDEYSYINSSQTNWYVKVTGENFDVMRLANVIKDIYEHLANTPGFDAAELRELFGREKKSDRELLIEDEFGTLDVIEEKSYADRIKENFFSRIRQFKNDYDCNTIDIDFFDFSENNFYNSQKIIEIFKQLNINVKDFCDKNFDYPINLMPYFEKKVSDFIIDKSTNYKNFLYTQALNNETKQKTFLADLREFKNHRISEEINTVNFDVVEYIKKKFGFDDQIISKNDAANSYKNNYEHLNRENKYKNEIANDDDVQQMIYFKKEQDFINWLHEQDKKEQINDKCSKIGDECSQFDELVPLEEEIKYADRTLRVSRETKHHQKMYALEEDIRMKRELKKYGNKGERSIYNLLCKKYGKDKVTPLSEAFVEMNMLPPGLSENGCDLSYIDAEGIKHYVEVKTGRRGRFYISENELNFAKEHADVYELYCVYNIDNPRCVKLPTKFWEDERYKLEDYTKILVCTF